MIALVLAKNFGWINSDTYWEINGILVALGLSTLRAGSKVDAQTAAAETVAKLDECKELPK
jgi:hypothetical protein